MSTERRERGAAAGRGVPGSGSTRRRGRACDVGDGNGASVGVSGGEPNMQGGSGGGSSGISGPIQCGLAVCRNLNGFFPSRPIEPEPPLLRQVAPSDPARHYLPLLLRWGICRHSLPASCIDGGVIRFPYRPPPHRH
jgi:hypothetical protein